MLDDLVYSFEMGGAKLNPHLLERFVLARSKEFVRSNQSDDEREHQLLTNLLHWHARLRQEKTKPEMSNHKLQLKFRQAWANIQQYILGNARAIFCTASTASRRTMRGFEPRYLVVEEAS